METVTYTFDANETASLIEALESAERNYRARGRDALAEETRSYTLAAKKCLDAFDQFSVSLTGTQKNKLANMIRQAHRSSREYGNLLVKVKRVE